MKLVWVLYVLKSSGTSWRQMLKEFIVSRLKFKSIRIDPDTYYRRNTRDNRSAYYKLLLV